MWRILGFGPGGDYIVGWIESNEKSDLIKLPPSAREWQYISSVGPSE